MKEYLHYSLSFSAKFEAMLFALCKNEDNNTASMRIFLQVWIFFFCTLFWPITVWINCSCDLKNFANSRPSASNFKRFSQSLKQFFLTVAQSNFGNKTPFFQEIRRTGIKPATDKRLKKVIENMSKYRSKQNVSLETLNLDLDQFKFVLSGNLPLLIKIFRNDLVIPEFASFCESVTTLYQKLKNNFNGEVSK